MATGAVAFGVRGFAGSAQGPEGVHHHLRSRGKKRETCTELKTVRQPEHVHRPRCPRHISPAHQSPAPEHMQMLTGALELASQAVWTQTFLGQFLCKLQSLWTSCEAGKGVVKFYFWVTRPAGLSLQPRWQIIQSETLAIHRCIASSQSPVVAPAFAIVRVSGAPGTIVDEQLKEWTLTKGSREVFVDVLKVA